MTAAAIASKFRRALRNGTGATLTPAELVEMREWGALIPFGILPADYVPPPQPFNGPWPEFPVVYFVGPLDGPIKIGFAGNLRARWRHLKYMSPQPLHIWAFVPGGADVEAEYHSRFKAARLHGEWFDRTEELVMEIARLCTEYAL